MASASLVGASTASVVTGASVLVSAVSPSFFSSEFSWQALASCFNSSSSITYGTTASAASASTTTAAATATTSRGSSAGTLSTRTLTVGAFRLLPSRLGLTGELNGDLTLQNLLPGELCYGTLRLGRSREVDEGITNRAVGTRVLWNRDRLTMY